jgi:hypothetical protein
MRREAHTFHQALDVRRSGRGGCDGCDASDRAARRSDAGSPRRLRNCLGGTGGRAWDAPPAGRGDGARGQKIQRRPRPEIAATGHSRRIKENGGVQGVFALVSPVFFARGADRANLTLRTLSRCYATGDRRSVEKTLVSYSFSALSGVA